MLLALADRRRKVADTLAAYIADRRDLAGRKNHPESEMGQTQTFGAVLAQCPACRKADMAGRYEYMP